jgi:transposase-like protein
MAGLIAAHHQDEDAARAYLEAKLWPEGPICPHCGIIGEAFKLNGETTRKGLWKCAACRAPFTVTVGTIFEDSKIPLHKWLFAIYLMCSSKKGMSAHQLWRNLWGVSEDGKQLGSYKTAWFMAHRIRWALGQEPIVSKMSGIVEIDEAYIGGKKKYAPVFNRDGEKQKSPLLGRKHPRTEKAEVVTLLQRGGDVRSYHATERVTGESLRPALDEFVEQGTHIMTDSAYKMRFETHGWKHSKVDHSKKEYARHEDGLTITTNTVEGYFSILKRGVNGIYHHVGKQYLDQYLREFDFRYNVRKMNDQDRTVLAIKKTHGKRLMLKEPKGTLKA